MLVEVQKQVAHKSVKGQRGFAGLALCQMRTKEPAGGQGETQPEAVWSMTVRTDGEIRHKPEQAEQVGFVPKKQQA